MNKVRKILEFKDSKLYNGEKLVIQIELAIKRYFSNVKGNVKITITKRGNQFLTGMNSLIIENETNPE